MCKSNMDRRDFVTNGLKVAFGLGTVWEGWMSYQYADVFGFDSDYQVGRTKNSVAALVAGIVGQQAYGNTSMDLMVKKLSWPDATLTGYTTEKTIDTYVDLLLTSARFQASTDATGQLEGEVHKSEFNWSVEQEGVNNYVVGRFGPKFDGRLHLKVQNGIIRGTYHRTGPHFNWAVEGTYSADGRVNISIDDFTTAGIRIEGHMNPVR